MLSHSEQALDTMSQAPIILGLDPGLCSLGWGIILGSPTGWVYHDSGACHTSSKLPLFQRLCQIYNNITAIQQRHKASIIVIEESFVNKNPMTSLKLGMAVGSALVAAGLTTPHIHTYKPNTVKKMMSGFGHSNKTQVFFMVRALLKNLPPDFSPSSHESDALAIALCHGLSMKIPTHPTRPYSL